MSELFDLVKKYVDVRFELLTIQTRQEANKLIESTEERAKEEVRKFVVTVEEKAKEKIGELAGQVEKRAKEELGLISTQAEKRVKEEMSKLSTRAEQELRVLTTRLIKILALTIIAGITLLFLSVTMVVCINTWLESAYWGFVAVTAFYFLLLILIGSKRGRRFLSRNTSSVNQSLIYSEKDINESESKG